MLKAIKKIAALGALAIMAACGGGGGSSGPVSSTDSFPLKAIYVSDLTTPSSNRFTITGSSNGVAVTGSGLATFGGLSNGTFEGAAAQQRTTTITGTITANGRSGSLNSSTVAWFGSDYLPKGESSSTGGYVVVMGTPIIPTTVRVNDTGTMYSAKIYQDSSKFTQTGTVTVAYVVEADTASTALLSLISTSKNISNTSQATNTLQLRISPNGSFTRVKETGTEGTTNLTITY